jgi:arylsulfatase A-like enzyme
VVAFKKLEMIDFVTLDDDKADFWEQNQELKYIEPFATFSKKKDSSDIMKAVYLVYDFKSKFNRGGIPKDKAKEDVAKNFLKKPNFKWDDYEEVIKAYIDTCTTVKQKALQKFEKDLKGLSEYMEVLSWADPDEAVIKKDINKEMRVYFNNLSECESLVNEEIKEKRFKGGYRMSPSEKMTSGRK